MSDYKGGPHSKHRFVLGNVKDDDTNESLSSLYLSVLAMISGGLLILANFLGAKIWHIGPIILDGGVIIFPFIYIAADLIVELYGTKIANKVVIASAMLNVFAILSCMIADLLPGLPDAENVDLEAAFALSMRVLFASSVAFLLGGFFNNFLFEKIRQKKPAFWQRALGSSFGAKIVDTTVFSIIAFAGRTSLWEMLAQIFWSFVIAIILESAVCPLTSRIAKFMQQLVLQKCVQRFDHT